MLFSSMFFLWVFLPIVLILSRIIKKGGQNILLLAASLVFYAWGEPRYIVLMLLAIFVNWLIVLLMARFPNVKKLLLVLTVVFNVGMLGIYKYTDFVINIINRIARHEVFAPAEIALPIGISFFTFQAMSYVFDYYRGEYPEEKNILNVALYISFFPQLIAGPIVKYKDIRTQIHDRTMTPEKTALGIRRFIYGLGKKVLIANTIAFGVDQIYGLQTMYITGKMAWVAAIGYMLQIYYDFSGYSDMAIGLSKMFGFSITENFRYPYVSTSIQEFWRRWHISLGAWFREYVYIPLGGNRKGQGRTYVNLLIVFAVTGLWHGADAAFIAWGLWHGLLQVIERIGWGKVLRKCPPLGWIYTSLAVMIGWILFRVVNVEVTIEILKRLFQPWLYTLSAYSIWELITHRMVVAMIVGILLMGPVQMLFQRFFQKAFKYIRYGWLDMVFCGVVFFLSILSLAANTYNPFIYFRF